MALSGWLVSHEVDGFLPGNCFPLDEENCRGRNRASI